MDETFIRLARVLAWRRRFKHKRGDYDAPQGWCRLGNGWFGEAWEHAEHPGLVVKVSGRGGFGADEPSKGGRHDAWPTFAEYCHANPHENLPNIMHFERMNASHAWAIMPKYTPLNAIEYGHEEYDNQRVRWQNWLYDAEGAPAWMWPIIGMERSLNMQIDLHQGNVMVNAEENLVMTDPFSARET